MKCGSIIEIPSAAPSSHDENSEQLKGVRGGRGLARKRRNCVCSAKGGACLGCLGAWQCSHGTPLECEIRILPNNAALTIISPSGWSSFVASTDNGSANIVQT